MKESHPSKPKPVGAIDLGGTKIATAVVAPDGKVLSRCREMTRVELGPSGCIAQMVRMLRAAMSQAAVKTKDLAGIAVGSPGPLDTRTGTVICAPNMPGWKNVPLAREIRKRFRIPVALDNDANAAALGEWAFGAGRGCRDMVYMTVSTGIGGGVIIGRKLYHGRTDGAGEIGHMTIKFDGPKCGCGSRGCLETLASGTAIARIARERIAAKRRKTLLTDMTHGNPSKITARLVYEAAARGDKLAAEIARETAESLGIGVANVINIFNPEKVVLGGGVTLAGDRLFDVIRRTARSRAFSYLADAAEIVPAALGEDVGIVGAAALILHGKAAGVKPQ